MRYLAYLKPKSGFVDRLSAFTREIGDHITGAFNLAPYCNIYKANLDQTKQREIMAALEDIARTQNPLELKLGKLSVVDESVLTVTLEPSDQLKALHTRIIEALGEHVVRPVAIPPEFAKDAKRIESIKKYGSPFVGEYHKPHLTLCYVDHGFNVPNTEEFEGVPFEADRMFLAKSPGDWIPMTGFRFKGSKLV